MSTRGTMRTAGRNIEDESITGADIRDKSVKPADLDLSMQSAFRMVKTTDQLMTANTYTKVIFNTEIYDHQLECANSEFVAKESGIYFLAASVAVDANANGVVGAIAFYKNNVLDCVISELGYEKVASVVVSGAVPIKLSAGDHVDIRVKLNQARKVNGTIDSTWFMGVKLT